MTLVLFSGGLDSVVALYYARHTGVDTTHALSFHYGQRHVNELKSADKIAQIAQVDHQIVVLPPALFPGKSSILGKNGVVRKYDTIPSHEEATADPAFIPHRNVIFLSIAASYAAYWGIDRIVTGLRGGFPDCTQLFEKKMSSVLRESDPDIPITVFSPCHGSRAETIGIAYDLPGCWQALAYSMTCFEGTEPPCGKCLPCLKRAEGFAKFGKPDPLLERIAEENMSGAYQGPASPPAFPI